jgi:hypothetical protein
MEKAEVTKLAQEEIANLVIKEFGMALEDGIKIKLLCQGMVIEDLKTIPDDACLHLLYLDSDFKPVNEEVNVFKNQYIAESKPNIG